VPGHVLTAEVPASLQIACTHKLHTDDFSIPTVMFVHMCSSSAEALVVELLHVRVQHPYSTRPPNRLPGMPRY
jgi:hypothetical protein